MLGLHDRLSPNYYIKIIITISNNCYNNNCCRIIIYLYGKAVGYSTFEYSRGVRSPGSSHLDGRQNKRHLLVNVTQIMVSMGVRCPLLACQCFRHNNIIMLWDRAPQRDASVSLQQQYGNVTDRQMSHFFIIISSE